MNLADQTQQIIDGLGGKTSKADLQALAVTLKADLDTSGAGLIEVVRDVDVEDGQPQPAVVSAFTPEGAQG